jgi:hypothetical protein
MTTLFSSMLEAPFASKRMVLRFPAPVHWRSYERMFNCPIDFDADPMEWDFGATVLDLPCPNADHREELPGGLRGGLDRSVRTTPTS